MRKRPDSATSDRGSARRALIIETATRLVSRNGSRGTTLAQIAAESGVSQPGLIYYFPSKEDLLHAALDARDAIEEDAMGSGGTDGLGVLDAIARTVDDWAVQPDAVGMHTVLVSENVGQDGPLRPRLSMRYYETIDRLTEMLRAAQEREEARADFDARAKAMEIIAFVNGLETAWLLNPAIPASQIAAQWAAGQRWLLQNATDPGA